MIAFKAPFSGLAVIVISAYAATDFGGTGEMGPAAFMWPADRVWSAAMDNTAPCGSVASVGNRSEFPMKNGKIALIGQDESYDIQLSISYLSDPKSNSDFSTLIDAGAFKEIDPGHTCVNVEDAPASVSAGDNATLQIQYIAGFDSSENQTFYACADITFVGLSDFDESIPCFNATDPEGDDNDDHAASGSSPSATASATPEKGKSGGGLSGGAIAGIVVGSIAGVALLAVAAFLLYRRGAKAQRDRALKQQQAARGVNWEDQLPKDSQSGTSVRMNNL
ncbi:Fc.00g048690.m01.CDS01 [Cosmosporella sp. VM-42]